MKKINLKLVAVILAAIMMVSTIACSAVNDNPLIGKIGDVKIYYSMYSNALNSYYYYIQQGTITGASAHAMIKEQLINYGVTLNKIHELDLESQLTDEENATIEEKIQSSIDSALSSYKVDESITDEDEIYNAKLEQFKAYLKEQKITYDEYVEDLRKSATEDVLFDKIRALQDEDVTLSDEDAKAYFDEMAPKDAESYDNEHISDFYTAYSNYITGNGIVPFYIPDDVFMVKHLLVKYTSKDDTSTEDDEEAHPSVPDGGLDGEYGVFDKDAKANIDTIVAELKKGISFEDFLNLIDEYGEDPGVQSEITEGENERSEGAYHDSGYVMHEELDDKWADEFYYAAMKLYKGEDWIPGGDEEDDESTSTATGDSDDEEDEDEEPVEYPITYYELTSGQKIARVETTNGVHFVVISEELTSGQINYDDYADNIKQFRLEELQDEHYEEVVKGWRDTTKIRMKDNYIDQIAVALGLM